MVWFAPTSTRTLPGRPTSIIAWTRVKWDRPSTRESKPGILLYLCMDVHTNRIHIYTYEWLRMHIWLESRPISCMHTHILNMCVYADSSPQKDGNVNCILLVIFCCSMLFYLFEGGYISLCSVAGWFTFTQMEKSQSCACPKPQTHENWCVSESLTFRFQNGSHITCVWSLAYTFNELSTNLSINQW